MANAQVMRNTLSAEEYRKRGVEKAKAHDLKGAMSDLDKALEIEPRFVKALVDRGIVLDDLGNKDAALKDFNAAIEFDPSHANSFYNRGITKAAIGDHRGAIRDFNETVKLEPENASAFTIAAIRGLRSGIT